MKEIDNWKLNKASQPTFIYGNLLLRKNDKERIIMIKTIIKFIKRLKI